VAVISCGAHNPFGHPDPGALGRLAGCGARVRRTDREGTVWLELGEDGVREIDWRRADFAARPSSTTSRAAGGALAHAPARW
jgi:beta-lactamase superfamily II metal-dependent hydrolase